MPKFDKTKRYKDKKGHTIGSGVWIGDKGEILKPGKGYTIDREAKTITQYNTDGTTTKYPWEEWAKKQAVQNELAILVNDRKWGIPVIPEKMMTISIDKKSPTRKNQGATFSENVLDSIAINSQRAGIPFSTGLGIAATESTIGKGERGPGHSLLPWNRLLNTTHSRLRNKALGITYDKVYSPTLLISNWIPRNESPFHNYFYDGNGYLLEKPKTSDFYNKDIDYSRRKENNYEYPSISPLEIGFRRYGKDPRSYNPNDSNYPDKVEKNRDELVNYSPEIRDYMKRNNLKAEGGTINHWNSLSMQEKAAMMEVAVRNGVTDLKSIREKYNEFANGGIHIKPENRGKFTALKERTGHSATWFKEHGTPAQKKMATFALNARKWHSDGGSLEDKNIFHEGGNTKSTYIYDELPRLLREAGLDIRVSSGYRPAGKVGTSGKRSWHWRHGAVDIVPQGKTTFEDIEKAIYSNPAIYNYMLANNFGLLDESGRSAESKATMKRTGATGPHFHFGRDSKPAYAYAQKMAGILGNKQMPPISIMPSSTPSVTQPVVTNTPVFLPSPEVFKTPLATYTPQPETATQTPVLYDPKEAERQEKAQYRRNFTNMMNMLYPQDSSAMGIMDMLSANNYFGDGGDKGNLFEKYAASGDQKTKAFNVFNWKQKPRRVWDTITGRYFVLGAGAISSASLMNE